MNYNLSQEEIVEIDKLAAMLQAIENDPAFPKVDYLHVVLKDGSVFVGKDEFDGVSSGDSHDSVEEASSQANVALITGEGHAHYRAHRYLEAKYGYHVYPGEKDSFGWLIGCIRTKKGVLTYG